MATTALLRESKLMTGGVRLRNTANYAIALEPEPDKSAAFVGWSDGRSVYLTPSHDTAAGASDGEPGVAVVHRSTRENELVHSLVSSAGRCLMHDAWGVWGWLIAVITEYVPPKPAPDASGLGPSKSSAPAAATFQLYVYVAFVGPAPTSKLNSFLLCRTALDRTPIEAIRGCVWNTIPKSRRHTLFDLAQRIDRLAVWTPATLIVFELPRLIGSLSVLSSRGPQTLQPAVTLPINAPANASATKPSLSLTASASSSGSGMIAAVCFGAYSTASVEIGVCTAGAQFHVLRWASGDAGEWKWPAQHSATPKLMYGMECGESASGKVIALHAFVRSKRQYWLAVTEAGIQFSDSGFRNVTRIQRIGEHSRFGARATGDSDPDDAATRSFFSSAPVSMFSLTAPPPLNMVYDSRWTAPRGGSGGGGGAKPETTATTDAKSTPAAVAAVAPSAPTPAATTNGTAPSAAEARRLQLWAEMTAHQTKSTPLPAPSGFGAKPSGALDATATVAAIVRTAPSAAAASLPSLFDIHASDSSSLTAAATAAATAPKPSALISLMDEPVAPAKAVVATDAKSSTAAAAVAGDDKSDAPAGAQILLFSSQRSADSKSIATPQFEQQLNVNASASATAPLQPSATAFDSIGGVLAISSYVSTHVLLYDLHKPSAARITIQPRAEVAASAAGKSSDAAATASSVRSGVRGVAIARGSGRLHVVMGDRETARGGFGLVTLSAYPELSALRLFEFKFTVAARPAPTVATAPATVASARAPTAIAIADTSVAATIAASPFGGGDAVTDISSLSMLVQQQQLTINSQAETIRLLQQQMFQLAQRMHRLETNAAATAKK